MPTHDKHACAWVCRQRWTAAGYRRYRDEHAIQAPAMWIAPHRWDFVQCSPNCHLAPRCARRSQRLDLVLEWPCFRRGLRWWDWKARAIRVVRPVCGGNAGLRWGGQRARHGWSLRRQRCRVVLCTWLVWSLRFDWHYKYYPKASDKAAVHVHNKS